MKILFVVVFALSISACSTVGQQQLASDDATSIEQSKKDNRDPWEGFNRQVFKFNDFLDRNLLKPVAKGYQWVTPDGVEHGVTNIFENLREVRTVVNGMLQWKWGTTVNSTGRFIVNSTVGVVGIFDVASGWGLEKKDGGEDFGQTLATWGVGSGPYLVLPLFGPATLRDGTGQITDSLVIRNDPVSYIEDDEARLGTQGLRIVDTRARLLGAEELLSGDRYSFVRDAYFQRRDFVIKDGNVEDDFGSESESYDDFEGFDDIEF